MRREIAISAVCAVLFVVFVAAGMGVASYQRLGHDSQQLVQTAYAVESRVGRHPERVPAMAWPPIDAIHRRVTELLAQAGVARAQTVWGARAQYGDGMPQDLAVMIEQYRAAAQQGYGPAQLLLALLYDPYRYNGLKDEWAHTHQGRRIEAGRARIDKSYERAARAYENAWENGITVAGLRLGDLYTRYFAMADDNNEKAAQWYERAARQDNARAAGKLAGLYEIGYGVPESKHKAITWLTRAAEGGDTEAAYALGNMRIDSKPAWRDYAEGARWLKKAANDGYESAYGVLALVYLSGTGVPRDYLHSYAWASLAAMGDNQSARDLRDKLESKMTAEQITEAQKLSQTLAERIDSR